MAVTNNTGATYASNISLANLYGYQITMKGNKVIVSAQKDASCDATTLYLFTTAGATLGTATFSGNVATFASPIAVSNGVTYYILCGKDGSASYSVRFNSPASPGFPISSTDLDFVGEVDTTYPSISFSTGTAINANFVNVVTDVGVSTSGSGLTLLGIG